MAPREDDNTHHHAPYGSDTYVARVARALAQDENGGRKYAPVGRKDDLGKPRWDLLPFAELEAVVEVLTFGARKYGDHNWRQVECGVDRYLAAALRHIVAHRQGETDDPESGLPHLAHAIASLLFLMGLSSDQ